MSAYQKKNLSYELNIRAGVHKRFMLIRDAATGLIQSAYNHRIFHASLTLSTLSNAIFTHLASQMYVLPGCKRQNSGR